MYFYFSPSVRGYTPINSYITAHIIVQTPETRVDKAGKKNGWMDVQYGGINFLN